MTVISTLIVSLFCVSFFSFRFALVQLAELRVIASKLKNDTHPLRVSVAEIEILITDMKDKVVKLNDTDGLAPIIHLSQKIRFKIEATLGGFRAEFDRVEAVRDRASIAGF